MSNNEFRAIPVLSDKQIERFWRKVDRGNPGECWPWNSSKCEKGYGRVWITRTGLFLAHRVAYFISTGIDPGGKCVLHSCDNPPCCNPAHHSTGSHQDNSNDMVEKRRQYQKRIDICEVDVMFMREMHWVGGIPKAIIAKAYGVSKSGVDSILKGISWSHVPMPIKTMEPRRTLGVIRRDPALRYTGGISEIDIFLMREMYLLGGFTPSRIANMFKVSFATVYGAVTGKRWNHIPYPDGFTPNRRA